MSFYLDTSRTQRPICIPQYYFFFSAIVSTTLLKNEWDMPHLTMHEESCIDHLWLFVGGNRAGEEAFSPAHIFKKIMIYKAETVSRLCTPFPGCCVNTTLTLSLWNSRTVL